jgi:hypothetical protein
VREPIYLSSDADVSHLSKYFKPYSLVSKEQFNPKYVSHVIPIAILALADFIIAEKAMRVVSHVPTSSYMSFLNMSRILTSTKGNGSIGTWVPKIIITPFRLCKKPGG